MKRLIVVLIGAAVLAACGSIDDSFAAVTLSTQDLAAIMAEQDAGTFLVDVRTAAEYAAGFIPGAINIPYDEITLNLPTDDTNARIIVYCRSGQRSGVAKSALEELGYTRVNDFGGITNWTEALVTNLEDDDKKKQRVEGSIR